jgi:triacylglycerol lipase
MKKFALFALFIVWHCSFAESINDQDSTKYPIVLIHGLFGYGNEDSGISSYWGDIPDLLRNLGRKVYVAEVSQAHDLYVCGEQLYDQLIRWGHKKYNLIGHSNGGLVARYILQNAPEMITSVTTIGTPHHGSKVADVVYGKIKKHRVRGALMVALGDLLSHAIGALSGNYYDQDSLSALEGLTTEGAKSYNRNNPIGVGREYCSTGQSEYYGIKLYSWGSFGGVKPRSIFDWSRIALSRTSKAFDEYEDNDGLVAVCSMKFGVWLGAYDGFHHVAPVTNRIVDPSESDLSWATGMFIAHEDRLTKVGC